MHGPFWIYSFCLVVISSPSFAYSDPDQLDASLGLVAQQRQQEVSTILQKSIFCSWSYVDYMGFSVFIIYVSSLCLVA